MIFFGWVQNSIELLPVMSQTPNRESFQPPNAPDANFRQPRDDDSALPAPSTPQGPLIALMTGLFEGDVASVYTCRGLSSWRSWLDQYLVLVPYDALVPGVLTVGDVNDIAAALAPCRVRMEASIDGRNRLADATHSRTSAANWLLSGH